MVKIACPKPPEIQKIKLLEINWILAVDINGNQVIGLTLNDYKNLGLNMQKILANVRNKNAIIRYYETCNSDLSKI